MIGCVLDELSLEKGHIGDCVSEMVKSYDILEPHKIFVKHICKSSPFVHLINHK